MSESLVTIALRTQKATAGFDVQHYLFPDTRVSNRATINVVQAMGLPNGATIENPNHSSSLPLLVSVGEPSTETITLPEDKASRLVSLFEKLQPGHSLQCHDVVTEVEGWDRDRGLEITQKGVQPPEFVTEPERIKPGEAYTVQVLNADGGKAKFLRTHSAIGTDNDRLLGIMGSGLVMATMDADTTRTIYANGAGISLLARAIIPE